MAEILEKRERNVIPLWRSFRQLTDAHGHELQSSRQGTQYDLQLPIGPLEDAAKSFVSGASVWTAASLVEAALTIRDDEVASEAAQYILEHAAYNAPARTLAETYLGVAKAGAENEARKIVAVIRKARAEIRTNLFDAIAWSDLGYGLTVAGKFRAAERAMITALTLEPDNTFIVRATARFFAHCDDIERGLRILRQCIRTPEDPWLTAAEIGLADRAKEPSRFLRRGRELLTGRYSPSHITELASAVGSHDFLDSSVKGKNAAKRLLMRSLEDANENSTAQYAWLRTVKKLDLDVRDQRFAYGHEAWALNALASGDVNSLIDHAKQWFYAEPYAERSAEMFSWAALSLDAGHESDAIEALKIATRANPQSAMLWNDLAFAHLLLDKTEEARGALRRGYATCEPFPMARICLTATEGLYLYRTGQTVAGHTAYLHALELAKEKGCDPRVRLAAYANLSHEEARVGSERAQTYITQMMQEFKACRDQPDSRALTITALKRIALLDPRTGDSTSIHIAREVVQEYSKSVRRTSRAGQASDRRERTSGGYAHPRKNSTIS